MHGSQPTLHDRDTGRSGPPSSFRAAFSQAREEIRSVGVEVTGELDPVPEPPADAPRLARYDVRIEKRSGKRSDDVARWNKLGQEGWMLISVVGRQAFFRRDTTPA